MWMANKRDTSGSHIVRPYLIVKKLKKRKKKTTQNQDVHSLCPLSNDDKSHFFKKGQQNIKTRTAQCRRHFGCECYPMPNQLLIERTQGISSVHTGIFFIECKLKSSWKCLWACRVNRTCSGSAIALSAGKGIYAPKHSSLIFFFRQIQANL